MAETLERVLRPFLFVFFKIFLKVPGHRKIMRPFANRFIGGETIDEAIEKGRELANQGFLLTFAFVGEEANNVDAVREAAQTYISLLDRIADEKLPADIAVKRSQFNCRSTSDRYFPFLRRVVKRASYYRTRVWFDAERLADQEVTINLGTYLHKHYGHIGLVLQAYAKDILIFLLQKVIPAVKSNPLPPAFRTCKGAYHEPTTLVSRKEKRIRENFRKTVLILSETTKSLIQIATHDLQLLRDSIAVLNPNTDYEMGMLLGVEEETARKLKAEGKKVRIYVVFGKPWDAFVARRLIEKPRYIKYIFQ